MNSKELLQEYKNNPKDIQRYLNMELGCHLVIDGIIGRNSRKCLRKLDQHEKGSYKHNKILEGDYNYISLAKTYIGTKEYTGKADNPIVLSFLRKVGLNWGSILHDSTPWCGAFVGAMMTRSGFSIPKNAGRALSWLNFGFDVGRAVYGSIAIKKRKGGGHVCFVIGRDLKTGLLRCLGGNQGDEVSIRLYKDSDFISFRLPFGYEDKIIDLSEIGNDPYVAKKAGRED